MPADVPVRCATPPCGSAGIRQAYFAFTAEEAEEYGLIGAGIDADFALPLDEQPMQVRHLPVDAGSHPFAEWRRRNAVR